MLSVDLPVLCCGLCQPNISWPKINVFKIRSLYLGRIDGPNNSKLLYKHLEIFLFSWIICACFTMSLEQYGDWRSFSSSEDADCVALMLIHYAERMSMTVKLLHFQNAWSTGRLALFLAKYTLLCLRLSFHQIRSDSTAFSSAIQPRLYASDCVFGRIFSTGS